MASAAERGRPPRTCARCGRTGFNAFEMAIGPADSPPEWVCTHREPCLTRRLGQWRAGSRAALGRPPSSPLAPWMDEDQKACVVGCDESGTVLLEELLRDLTPLDVERLDQSPRSMARLSRGEYCLVVVESTDGDPLAFCNELARRLSGARLARVPLIVVTEQGTQLRGPLAALAERTEARLLARPVTVSAFNAAIAASLGWSATDAVCTA